MYNVLICDDQPDIVNALKIYLKSEGYQLFTAYTGKEAVEIVRDNEIHLILLDVMMPVMDGITATAKIREFSNAPIILLTAKSETEDKVLGLNVGADDYITKPVSMRVLCSRVNAVMKRLKPEESIPFNIDPNSRVVSTPSGDMVLPKKEFELVQMLISDPGKVFTREEIFSKIWGGEVVVGDRTLDVHIRRLRRKLGDQTITTHKGIGFKIEI